MCWFEFFIVVLFYIFMQMEGIGFIVFVDFLFFSEVWDYFGGVDFKFNQMVIKWDGRGVIGGVGGKQLWVKFFWRFF